MKPAPYRIEDRQGRLLFLLTLWLAIGVALLSALAPLGPPSSRYTGSAFNPATTSVVLKARSLANPVAVRVTEPDGVPTAIALLPVAALIGGVWLLRPVTRFSRPQASPLSLKPLSRPRARAPPAFS